MATLAETANGQINRNCTCRLCHGNYLLYGPFGYIHVLKYRFEVFALYWSISKFPVLLLNSSTFQRQTLYYLNIADLQACRSAIFKHFSIFTPLQLFETFGFFADIK